MTHRSYSEAIKRKNEEGTKVVYKKNTNLKRGVQQPSDPKTTQKLTKFFGLTKPVQSEEYELENHDENNYKSNNKSKSTSSFNFKKIKECSQPQVVDESTEIKQLVTGVTKDQSEFKDSVGLITSFFKTTDYQKEECKGITSDYESEEESWTVKRNL